MNFNVGDVMNTIINFAIVIIFVFTVNYLTNVVKNRKKKTTDDNGIDNQDDRDTIDDIAKKDKKKK